MGEKIRKLSRYATILFCIHHIKSRWSYGIGSKTLAKLRDTLLPKLLSGELSIPEAEKTNGQQLMNVAQFSKLIA